jgi:short subunit dehydrogenase-like uncharacterized protein
MSADRPLDVLVYGATGFVGRLTAEYLAAHAPDGVRIGLGGRSREKLERVRGELGPRAADWPVHVADSQDDAAVRALAEATRVVATTVGPYQAYGMPLARACAEAGTDYADLTGEVLFMRRTIDELGPVAEGTGARIVHTCGFDSIPSDLGVLLLHEAAQAAGAGELEDTTLVVRAMKGGASGGTLASMKGQIDEIRRDREARRLAQDPYALSPDRSVEPDLGAERDVMGPVHDDELGLWLGPFVMAAVNTRVVRRSNALQGWAYGRRLRYRETMATGPGIAGRAKALGLTGGLGALVAGLTLPPTRKLLDRVLPSPGEGPGEEARRRGFFKIEVHARTSQGARYVARCEAQGDPGYAATAVMLGESALCLALDRDRLPERAGVLTPATAMGTVLAERLNAAGQTYVATTA